MALVASVGRLEQKVGRLERHVNQNTAIASPDLSSPMSETDTHLKNMNAACSAANLSLQLVPPAHADLGVCVHVLLAQFALTVHRTSRPGIEKI
jgi:hypothetical protein